jgi:hypothetical protein
MKNTEETTAAAEEIFETLKAWPNLTKKTCHIFKSRDGQITTIGTYRDVYEGLEIIAFEADHEMLTGYEFFGLETSGWAAPLVEEERNEVPPSEHPERRRVRMVSVLDRTMRLTSVLGFEGDDKIVSNQGGQGTLADAMRLVMASIVSAEANQSC